MAERLVPDAVIPHKHLPPLRYRDLPEPIAWRKMLGPSIILAGLSLGSGEFVLWPHIAYAAGLVFFWAAVLGVATQYFLNMEIERWTLATGESAITGFCRLSRHWAWIFLILNIVPWAWPGWATGAAQLTSWLVWGPTPSSPGFATGGTAGAAHIATQGVAYEASYVPFLAIGGLWLVGLVLTLGPVVYNTVERIQTVLVLLILVLVVVLAARLGTGSAWLALAEGTVKIGRMPDPAAGLSLAALLGALAFAGAGGTMNLGQSNFIKDKGYAMGRYIGRITSPITGKPEPISDIGYHFEHTPENMRRWRGWWRAANIEHFFSFFCTCLLTLVLLSVLSYSLFYADDGSLRTGTGHYGAGMNFVWGEAVAIARILGSLGQAAFLLMGVAILLTTELGVLDTSSRISADIVKVNWLRDSEFWTQSRLYYCFLWSEIALGTAILAAGWTEPLELIVIAAASNGFVMLVYSILLLYLNNKVLSRSLSMSPLRFVAIIWACAFFGYFSIQALANQVIPTVFAPLFGGE